MSTFTRDAPVDTRPPVKHRKPRRRGKVVALTGLGLIMVLFIAGAAVRIIGGTNTPGAAVPAAAAPDPAQGADGRGPEHAQQAPTGGPSCGSWATTPNTDTPDLTTMPATTWILVGGMAAPSDPTTGPALTTPVRSCYNRTPPGALFAAANYLAQMQDPAATPATELQLATITMADTPTRAGFLQQWANPAPTKPVPPTVVDVRAAFVAFHFVAYTQDLAMIDMASAWNGHLNAAIYTLRYASGSWLIDPPDTGRWAMRALPVQDRNYWTPWSAA